MSGDLLPFSSLKSDKLKTGICRDLIACRNFEFSLLRIHRTLVVVLLLRINRTHKKMSYCKKIAVSEKNLRVKDRSYKPRQPPTRRPERLSLSIRREEQRKKKRPAKVMPSASTLSILLARTNGRSELINREKAEYHQVYEASYSLRRGATLHP